MNGKLLFGLAVMLSLSACASRPVLKKAPINSFIDKQTNYVIDEVADAAKYPGALAEYNQNAVTVIGKNRQALDTVVNAEWNGTLEQLTRKMARALGYSVRLQGERLPNPTIASVNSYSLTAIGLLRQAFAQGRGRAELVIDTNKKLMTYVTRRSERSPIPHQSDTQL